MKAAAPKATCRVLEDVLEIVRRRPGITVRELADELAGLHQPDTIRVLHEALELVVGDDRRERDDQRNEMPPSWGPLPSSTEISAAQNAGDRMRAAALDSALAGALTREDAAARLGVSPQAVSDRLKAGKLIGLRRGREWRFPVWQFGDDSTLPGLDRLIASWPGTPLSLSVWANKPSADLAGRSPAQELVRRGGPGRVLDVVDSIASAAW